MRKFLLILFFTISTAALFAQSTSKKTISLPSRSGDHLMLQLATNVWTGEADSVSNYLKKSALSGNIYVMLDKPFKNNPKFSLGIGIGIGSNNIAFDKMEVRLGSNRMALPFIRTDTGSHYNKYKLSTSYLEIPLELRFTKDPTNSNKSLKGALGVKVGTLLSAHTKGKNLENVSGNKLNSNTVKEAGKSYFNSTRIAATARIGYGVFSIFGAYSLTSVFKDAVAPEVKPFQIGISISGL